MTITRKIGLNDIGALLLGWLVTSGKITMRAKTKRRETILSMTSRTIRVPEDAYHQLALLAALEDRSIQDLAAEAVAGLLERRAPNHVRRRLAETEKLLLGEVAVKQNRRR